MKTLITLMLLISTVTHGQVSIDLGVTGWLQGTGKIAVEKQTGWLNTELSARIATDNMHPVIGLQTGYSTTNDFQQANIRFQVGAFLHTGLLPIDKEVREMQVRFGGSIRYELNHGTVGIEYNGETLNLTVGFIFKSRYQ